MPYMIPIQHFLELNKKKWGTLELR
jgi:hypothetical protein